MSPLACMDVNVFLWFLLHIISHTNAFTRQQGPTLCILSLSPFGQSAPRGSCRFKLK